MKKDDFQIKWSPASSSRWQALQAFRQAPSDEWKITNNKLFELKIPDNALFELVESV